MNLIQGDCLEVMKQIPDASVGMILCDLPYGITRNKWDCEIDLKSLWIEYDRVAKSSAAVVLTASQPFTSSLVFSNRNWFRYSLIWVKSNPSGFLNARRMPLRTHEDVLVFYRSLPIYNPQKTSGHKRKTSTASHRSGCALSDNYGVYTPNTYDSTERFPTSVLTFPKDKQKSALHPTQKPVALMEYLIRTYTNEGAIVLDNCMGSGSTGVACVNTKREFIGIEQDPKYFKIAQERIEAVG